MTDFQNMFFKSKGKPIEYNGKIIQMVDKVAVGKNGKVIISFVDTNSEWLQGLSITTKGFFVIAGVKYPNSIVLWERTAPKEVQIEITSKTGDIFIKNVWDVGDGCMNSWHNGAGMIVEKIEKNKYRYLCNDGHPDDDFDDLIFSVNLIESTESTM